MIVKEVVSEYVLLTTGNLWFQKIKWAQ